MVFLEDLLAVEAVAGEEVAGKKDPKFHNEILRPLSFI